MKRVLVTGSSRGIGRSIAARLATDGWSVALHCTGPSKDLEATQKMLGSKHSGTYFGDLADTTKAKAMIKAAFKDGDFDAIVNNAGVYLPLNFAESGDASFEANLRKTFAVNFESPLLISREAVKHFSKSGGGKILNVASRVGFRGEGGASLYAASKAALINLTRSLAVELAPKNIGMFGIAPGWVDTAMAREGMEDRLPSIIEGIPVGRMASPEDCAASASFLLSDQASYLSGVVIDINGASYFH